MNDEEFIAAYAKQNPDCLPANNKEMRAAVNDPGYIDRGLWGPYGGKFGTVSTVWLEEHRPKSG